MSRNRTMLIVVGAVVVIGLCVVLAAAGAWWFLRSRVTGPGPSSTSPITGQVTDAIGTPMSGATVYLRAAGPDATLQAARGGKGPSEAGAGGAGVQPDFSGLPTKVDTDMPVADAPQADAVTSKGGAAKKASTGEDENAAKSGGAGGAVSGIGADGSLVDAATAAGEDATPQGQKVATSDGKGAFSMQPPKDGKYVLSASKDDAYAELQFSVKNGYVDHVDGRADNLIELNLPAYAKKPSMLPPVDITKDTTTDEDAMRMVKNVLEVVWKQGVPAKEHQKILEGIGGLRTRGEIEDIGVTEVEVTEDDLAEATVKLEADTNVESAVKDYIVEPDFVPRDPDYAHPARSWWLRRIRAEQVWDIIRLKRPPYVTIAVIDSGFQKHPDLKKVFIKALARNYTDEPISAQPRHGNHVTGVIAMKSNTIGLVGISPRTYVVPMKVRTVGHIAQAIRAAADIRGVKAISISMGYKWKKTDQNRAAAGQPPLTQAQRQAISDEADLVLMPAVRAAKDKGVLVVHSAGNDGGFASSNMMNDGYDLITVAASRPTDRLATFSNSGTPVTIMAPGQWIWSTVGDGDWKSLSGTSMSTPVVAGTIALMRALNGELEPDDIRGLLQKSSDSVGDGPVRLNSWKAALAAMKSSYGIIGTVVDQNDKPVPDAKVKVVGAPDIEATTDESGAFIMAAVPSSKWNLTAREGGAAAGTKPRRGRTPVIPAGDGEYVRENVVAKISDNPPKPLAIPKETGYVVVNVTNYGTGGYRAILKTEELKYPLDIAELPGGGRTPTAGVLKVIGSVYPTELAAAESFAGQIRNCRVGRWRGDIST